MNGRPKDGPLGAGLPGSRNAEGVVLLDGSLRVLAFDEGAAAILMDPLQAPTDRGRALQVPKEIMDSLQATHISGPRKLRVFVDNRAYICRIYAAQSRTEGFPAGITVLHLMRDFTMADALVEISAEYRLTSREQQALEGVLLGLSSKEVAERMSISPNTVKAFLRLVMGKMGVTSRTGFAAKLFEPHGHVK